MLVRTSGIVLSFIKYGETSIISKIYTEKYGIQSYIINGVRSKTSKTKISLFQPLTMLDLVVYHKETVNLHRISEAKCNYPYTSIIYNSQKVVISFFLQEFLSKILRNEQSNKELFDFLGSSLRIFDMMNDSFQNFHLQFILKISDHLGISILSTKDLFEHIGKVHVKYEELKLVDQLLNDPFDSNLQLHVTQRREILKDVLKYYAINYEGMTELRSIDIIRDILD